MLVGFYVIFMCIAHRALPFLFPRAFTEERPPLYPPTLPNVSTYTGEQVSPSSESAGPSLPRHTTTSKRVRKTAEQKGASEAFAYAAEERSERGRNGSSQSLFQARENIDQPSPLAGRGAISVAERRRSPPLPDRSNLKPLASKKKVIANKMSAVCSGAGYAKEWIESSAAVKEVTVHSCYLW